MRIAKIELQGFNNFQNRTIVFDDINFIHGLNGAGKSTILQAIQYALIGYIPGVPKTNSGILMHSMNGDIKVKLTIDDSGSPIVVTRELKALSGSNAKFSENFKIEPEDVRLSDIIEKFSSVVINFSEFLGMSSNKQKDFLIQILPEVVNLGSLKEFLESDPEYNESLSSYVDEILDEISAFSTISDILEFNKYAKDQKSQIEASEKRVISTIQSIVYYDDVVTTYTQEDVRKKLESLNDDLQVASINNSNIARYECALKEFSKFGDIPDSIEDNPEYIKLSEQQSELISARNPLKSKQVQLEDTASVYQLQAESYRQIIRSNNVCPYLQTTCESLKNRCEEISEDCEKLEQIAESCKQELKDVNAKIHDIDVRYTEIQHEKSEIEKIYAKKAQLAAIRDEVKGLVFVDTDAIKSEIAYYTDLYGKICANDRYQGLISDLDSEKVELQQKKAFIKSIIKRSGENGLPSKLMAKPFSLLEIRMYEILNILSLADQGIPRLLLAQKANSFDFGYERNNKFISFSTLSSGEKCIFTMIFILAVICESDSPLKFVLLDDVFDHLDSSNFNKLISGLKTVNTDKGIQFILAGVDLKSIETQTDDINCIHLERR